MFYHRYDVRSMSGMVFFSHLILKQWYSFEGKRRVVNNKTAWNRVKDELDKREKRRRTDGDRRDRHREENYAIEKEILR